MAHQLKLLADIHKTRLKELDLFHDNEPEKV